MTSSVAPFLDKLPDWLEVTNESGLPDTVELRTGNIGPDIGRLALLLKSTEADPSVEELDNKSKKLPDFCFERHIMPDRTFCLGHIEGRLDSDKEDIFWLKLRAFLENQDYAARHGLWPIEQGMSHSEISMRAQSLIEDAIRSDEGLLQEWLGSAFRGKGWISDVAHRTSTKSQQKYTSRQPCPRGCTKLAEDHAGCKLGVSKDVIRKGKKDRPVLVGDCKKPELISRVITLEHIRWSSDQLLHRTISEGLAGSTICCGTMKMCPMNIEG